MGLINIRLFFYLTFIILATGCLVPLLLPRRWKTFGTHYGLSMAMVAGILCIAAGFFFWSSPMQKGEILIYLPNAINGEFPTLGLSIYADQLSAFFLLITGFITFATALHSMSWMREIEERHRITAVFNLFVLSIISTILANNVYFFLVFLECMTLTFSYLALFRHNLYLEKRGVSDEDLEHTKNAFRIYLIFEHLGVIFLAAGLIVLALFTIQHGGKVQDVLDFRTLHEQSGSLASWQSNIVFLLVLAGLGIKAGVFPAHVWVSLVHPYSPTSIHAMMSGIALKVAGVYGMYRIFFGFLGQVQWWWGWVILLLAGMTALVGVFNALVSKDLKKGLASHSVENIGIILTGIGLALIYSAYFDLPANIPSENILEIQQIFKSLAALSLVASLYHLINHSVFKSLLFFCTGAIENRVGTVSMEKLGGLLQKYPWTGTAFLIGAFSIAGFPPFNGFISEWLTLQAFFSGMNLFLTPQTIVLLVGMVLALVMLTLAFGLTALAFVKMVGEVLLGAPRDPEVAARSEKGDVPWRMRSVLIGLASLCLFLGLTPALMIKNLNTVATGLIPNQDSGITQNVNLSTIGGNLNINVPIYSLKATPPLDKSGMPIPFVYVTRLSLGFLVVMIGILAIPIGFIALRALPFFKKILPQRKGPVWTGGTIFNPEQMQYSGTALTSSAWQPFQTSKNGEKKSNLAYMIELTGSRRIFGVFSMTYDRLVSFIMRISQGVGDWFQNGDIRRYLIYILIIFIIVLLSLFFIKV
jgi:hydrogenase-4 component B